MTTKKTIKVSRCRTYREWLRQNCEKAPKRPKRVLPDRYDVSAIMPPEIAGDRQGS